jgi:sugar phosphate permease
MRESLLAVPAARKRSFFYGWAIVATLAVTETVSYGILYYAFAIFIDPMRAEFGWSSSAVTGALSLALLVSGFSAPLVGMWLDRHGPRLLMTLGSVIGTAMVLAWSRVDSLLPYYAIWLGMGFAMATTFYEPAFATLTRWFERDRRRAIVYVTLVAGFASTIFLPFASWLEGRYGWREALVLLAVVLGALTILPHALVLRRRPEDLGLYPDGATEASVTAERTQRPSGANLREALNSRTFWWLTASFFVQNFSGTAVALYMIPYLTNRGVSAGFAATATGLIGAAQVAARLLTSLFGERVSHLTLTTLVFALQAVAVAILIEWRSDAGVLAAVLLLGAGRGVVTLMRPGLVVDFFGKQSYGAISGSMALFLTLANAAAPVTVGFAYATLDDYEPVLWALAVMALLGAAGMVRLRRYPSPVAHLP